MNEKLEQLCKTLESAAIKAGGAAANVAYAAGRQAETLTDSAKRELTRMDLKAERNVLLRELGELLYATHTGSPTDSEVLLAKMEEIDAVYAKLSALGGAAPRCPDCGAPAPDGDRFCRKCGAALRKG